MVFCAQGSSRLGAIALVIGAQSLISTACSASDPIATDAGFGDVGPTKGSTCDPPVTYEEDVSGCARPGTDYTPRIDHSASDAWPACISDDGAYHPLQPSISTIARVAAFEAIAGLLWKDGKAPTAQDFLSARVYYEEEQGLSSRLVRRYDPHFQKPSTGGCDDPAVASANRDYCVGPAKLQPLVVQAFAEGAQGKEPVVMAARIEAALLWFFYVSAVKEATTCAGTPADCDSAWAYYTGGGPRDAPLGLSRIVRQIGQETHDRIWDGILAVRCWKSLDHETGASTDLTLRDRAITQLDRGLLRGLALFVRQRFLELGCSTLTFQAASFEKLKILVPLLDRETQSRDAAAADALVGAVTGPVEAVNISEAVAKIDEVYGCP